MTCDVWQVVVVPFPFVDRATAKRRPAPVVSAGTFNRRGYSVLAMITSASHQAWPADTVISDLNAAGLTSASVVRLKLFTLDNRFIIRRVGRLGSRDQASVAGQLRAVLPALAD